MTDITRIALEMKSAAEKAKHAGEAPVMPFDTRISTLNEYQLTVCPDNVLALVEALENTRNENELARGQLLIAGRTLLNQQEKIAELESSVIAPDILRCTECSFVQTKNIISVTADTITTGNSESESCPNGCGQLQPVTWKALAIQLMFTTKQGVSDLLEAKKRIAELEPFHTAYMEWSDKTDWVQTDKRFGVVKPLGKHRADVLKEYIQHLESRTVKLPAERFCPAEYSGSQLWSETEVWNQAISACNGALRTAGIKVEAE